MRASKGCVDAGLRTDLAGGIEIEMDAIRRSLESEEWRQGLDAFARNRAKPRTS